MTTVKASVAPVARSRLIPKTPSSLPPSVHALAWLELREHPSIGLLFLVSAALHAASHGAVAWCAGSLGRALVGDASHLPVLGQVRPFDVAFIGFLAVAIKGIAGVFSGFAQSRLAGSAADSLRDTTLAAILCRGTAASLPDAVASVVSRLREAELAVHQGSLASLRSSAQLLPVLVGLWVLSPKLTAVALLCLLPFALVLSRARRGWRARHQKFMAAADQLHAEMDDVIRHTDLWRTYGTGRYIRSMLHRLGRRVVIARTRSDTFGVALSSANEVLGALALVVTLAFAQALGLELADGSLIAFAAMFFMAYRPLRDLGDARSSLAKGQEALAVLASLAGPQQNVGESEATPDAGAQPQLLTVREVGVPGRTPYVSFTAPPGCILAVAGPTGAGKTTLLRALLGLEDHAAGCMTYGSRKLLPGQVGPQHRPFAWVPQEAPIVSGSLDDNCRVAGTTEGETWSELCSMGAADLRSDLAKVKLGAAGRPLSGGERRWIGLARALATRLPVLLLDEPTAGLDPRARRAVLAAIQSLRGRRTIVLVSHDDDVLAVADEIVRVPVSDLR